MPYEWPEFLTYDEKIKIVVDQLNCSRGHAKKIVHAYWSSVLPYAPTQIQIEHQKSTKKGFQDWLSRHYLTPPSEQTTKQEKQSRDTWQKVAIREAIAAVFDGRPLPFSSQSVADIAEDLDNWLQNNRDPTPSPNTIRAYLREIKPKG
jgi:hypothetical protein